MELEKELALGPAVYGWEDQRWTLARIRALIAWKISLDCSSAGEGGLSAPQALLDAHAVQDDVRRGQCDTCRVAIPGDRRAVYADGPDPRIHLRGPQCHPSPGLRPSPQRGLNPDQENAARFAQAVEAHPGCFTAIAQTCHAGDTVAWIRCAGEKREHLSVGFGITRCP